MFYYILLIQLVSGMNSPTLEGSFESRLKNYTRGEGFSETRKMEITDVAWRGERLSKQIVLWAEGEIVNDIDYMLSDLVSERDVISSDNGVIRFLDYARADRESKACGGYLSRDPQAYAELGDVLSTEKVTTVDPAVPVRLWLTLNVPESADEGYYSGTFTVTVNGSPALNFQINLMVVDQVLPGISDWEFHLDLWQFPTAVIDRYNDHYSSDKLDYWSAEHFKLLEPKYRILADMGQKVITAHIKEGALGTTSMVKWIKKPYDSWKYDFSVFDRYVDSLMSWGIDQQISCQSPVGWNKDEIPYWDEAQNIMQKLYAPPGSNNYQTRWDHFLTQFKLHLDTKGWFSKTVLFLDEVESSEMSEVIQMIKNNHMDWKIGMAGFHTPSEFVDTNAYDMSLMVGVKGNAGRSGRLSTFYFSCNPPHPNNFIVGDARPAENIWIGWHALHMNHNGFLRWAYDYWLESDPFEMRTGGHTSGDFSLCYRNSNTLDMRVYSSVRLELIREGIQDFEKIKILKKRFKNSVNTDDIRSLHLLNNKISEFTATSGKSTTVTELVKSAQRLLKEIVTWNTADNNYSDSFRNAGYNIYPNPMISNYLNISFANYHGQENISIFDILGKSIYSENLNIAGNSKHTIQLEGCSGGVYIFKVSSERQNMPEYQKLMISR